MHSLPTVSCVKFWPLGQVSPDGSNPFRSASAFSIFVSERLERFGAKIGHHHLGTSKRTPTLELLKGMTQNHDPAGVQLSDFRLWCDNSITSFRIIVGVPEVMAHSNLVQDELHLRDVEFL